jgi:EAL domain-containing protein (putative c-di-GMP-specific phosphodiesterase class I)
VQPDPANVREEPSPDPVQPLAAAIHELEDRFRPGTALGVLVIDGSALREIERAHGGEAYRSVLDRVVRAVQQINSDVFGGRERVAAGELGRGEVVAFFLREEAGRTGLPGDLPAFEQQVVQALADQTAELLAPYGGRLPPIRVGSAVALRHPRVWLVAQVRDLLEQARGDAELNLRLAQRERRHGFLEVLLARRLKSVFEPIVSASNFTVFGYEALARGPSDGPFASAASLFAAADEHDMIYELDALCAEAALAGATDLPAGTKLFLNIRPTSMEDLRFQPRGMLEKLERVGLKPSDVVFEISEQESIKNYPSFRQLRDTYRGLGFQFALDDTGAGYASLEAVMEVAPDFIKVDRAFVRGVDEDPARQAMFCAFREAARSVGARLIAEGLDRIEELQTISKLGIDLGQGWLFGRPTPLRASGS